MATRQYIGARYVTKVYENSLDPSSAEWEANVNYEPLTMVTFNNGSYLSKKTVPASVGNPPSNPTYWTQTGFYNGQILALENEVDKLNMIGVTPQMYGAKADGVTDDTAAIQQALDENTTVYFPASDHPYIFTSLTVNEGNRLIGMGGVLKLKDNFASDDSKSYYPIWAIEDNTYIDGLIIDGNAENNTHFTVCDNVVLSGKNSQLKNCVIMNAPDSGITFSMAENAMICGNVIDGGTDNGIYVNSGELDAMKHFVIANNIICNFTNSAIACKRQTTKGLIDGNYLHDCDFGVTMESVSPYPSSSQISITNNYMYNIRQFGVYLRDGSDHVVAGNTIRGCNDYAFMLDNCNNVTVSGNLFETSDVASTTTFKALMYVNGDTATPTKGININGNTIKIHNNLNVLCMRGNVDGVLLNDNTIIYDSANTAVITYATSAGGYTPTNLSVIGNYVDDANSYNHNIQDATIACNNNGNCATYQQSNVPVIAALYLPESNDAAQGSGQVRIINSFRSTSARNGALFKKFDIVLDQLDNGKFNVLVAKDDGRGDQVLETLATMTFTT